MSQSPNHHADSPLSQEQFMRLFLQSEREILRYVMAIVPNVADARDILQETAMALWKAAERYDPNRPFLPWACRFALNEARMFLRTEGRRQRFLREDVVALLETRRQELAPRLDARREHLQECLAALPADQRSLIKLWESTGFGNALLGPGRTGHLLTSHS